jgi:hypothetical protein
MPLIKTTLIFAYICLWQTFYFFRHYNIITKCLLLSSLIHYHFLVLKISYFSKVVHKKAKLQNE